MVFDVACYIGIFQSVCLCSRKVSFHFAVQSVSHQLEHDVTVAVNTRTLPLQRKFIKYLVDICHIEIAAQTEVLCPPVVASQKRMHIRNAALARCGIAQMTHVQFACEG